MSNAKLSDHVERLMTVDEIAKYLRIHPSTIYRLARDGAIPLMKLGGSYRFRLSAVLRAMENANARK